MAVKGTKKRSAHSSQVSPSMQPRIEYSWKIQRPSKKRKVADDGKSAKAKVKGKDRASDKPTIEIPNRGDEDDVELSDDDLELLQEYGGAVSFLTALDEKGIAR